MARGKRVGVKDLDTAINQIFEQYAGEVNDNVEEITTELGQAGAKEIRAKARDMFGGTGKYARDWTSIAESDRFGTTATIYNKNHYQLAHLLEFGHANRGGGRTPGTKERTEGKAHIKPVEEKIIKEYISKLEGAL